MHYLEKNDEKGKISDSGALGYLPNTKKNEVVDKVLPKELG